MMLTQKIDFEAVALAAELRPDKTSRFLKGITGKEDGVIRLSRETYTTLQMAFERAVLDVLKEDPDMALDEETGGDKWRPPFLYHTPVLATPIHNSHHPRARIIEDMVKAPEPFAAFLCNFEALRQLGSAPHLQSPHALERLMRLLTPHHADIDPFSCNPAGKSTGESHMAMRGFAGVAPIQFEASQMSQPGNHTPGRVVFGESALRAYEHSWTAFLENTSRGMSSKVLRDEISGG